MRPNRISSDGMGKGSPVRELWAVTVMAKTAFFSAADVVSFWLIRRENHGRMSGAVIANLRDTRRYRDRPAQVVRHFSHHREVPDPLVRQHGAAANVHF